MKYYQEHPFSKDRYHHDPMFGWTRTHGIAMRNRDDDWWEPVSWADLPARVRRQVFDDRLRHTQTEYRSQL